MEFKERLMNTMLELIEVPGISGTKSENLAADKVYEILNDIPYFKENPDDVRNMVVKDDPLERRVVTALYKSKEKTNKTFVLMGHHDVVAVDNYGHLKDLAFHPKELTKRIDEMSLSEDAKKDLESGDWLFGRGVNDMKYGVALNIELLRDITEDEDFVGNILFLCVGSEEYNSEGMLGAIDYLVDLQNEGLSFDGLLLPEPSSLGDEDEDKIVHIGAGGKMNALLFFVGKENHVAEAFNGINVNSLASEFNRLMELNLRLTDEFDGELGDPPTCLKQKDLKNLYDVTTPLYAASFYNIQTLNSKVEDIINKLKDIATTAFENVIEDYENKVKIVSKKREMKTIDIKPSVLTYNDLSNKVKEKYGEKFDNHMGEKIKEWEDNGLDKQTIAINITKETFDWYPDKSPAIIVGFAPPYYPSRYPELDREDYKRYYKNVDDMIDYAKEKYDVSILKNNFFTVSDFSYIELGDKKGIDDIKKNLVGINKIYMFPTEKLKELSIPGIVFGPWGKEFHQYTERINIPYSFGVVPDLVRKLIYDFFI